MNPFSRIKSQPRVREVDARRRELVAERRLARVARSGKPIVAGPWLGEMGMELLFWVPFLRWLRDRFEIGPARVTAISRGGAGLWYADVATRYVEIFDGFEPADFRAWTERRERETNAQKQTRIEDADRAVLAWAQPQIGDVYELVHPSEMYWLFAGFWDWQRARTPLRHVLDRTVYAPLAKPEPDARLAGLPSEYVAVKGYFNRVFPGSEANRAFLRELIGLLRRKHEVVLLDTGLGIDDHPDFEGVGGGAHSIAELLSPRDNLDLQTRAVAGAKALFCTHGGFSYLGPYLGVDSYSFYEHDAFIPTHRELWWRARRALREAGVEAANVPFPVASARSLADALAAAVPAA